MFESVDPSPSGKLVDEECQKTRCNMTRILGQTGQSTVEFVLVLPLVIIVLLCTLQVVSVVRTRLLLEQAVHEAARAAALSPDQSIVLKAARRALPGVDLELGNHREIGDSISVVLRIKAHTDIPVVGPLLPDPIMKARAVVRVER
ncbi:TadE-like protein [Actinobacteria bacterium IMCC26256]|nr:TadE-like protein [Actinobacteria bacterium IMCC26256]